MAMKFNAATIFILVLFNNTENKVTSCIYTNFFENFKWTLDHTITYRHLLINFILIEQFKQHRKTCKINNTSSCQLYQTTKIKMMFRSV